MIAIAHRFPPANPGISDRSKRTASHVPGLHLPGFVLPAPALRSQTLWHSEPVSSHPRPLASGRRVVEDFAAAYQSDVTPTLTVNGAGLSERNGAALRLSIHSQPFPFHRCDSPLLQRIVRGLKQVRLPGCTDVGAEVNPRIRLLYQILAAFHIRIDPQTAELMTAQSAAMARFLCPGEDAARNSYAPAPRGRQDVRFVCGVKVLQRSSFIVPRSSFRDFRAHALKSLLGPGSSVDRAAPSQSP